MSFDYARIARTADRLIENFGQIGVLRRPGVSGGPTFDPVRGDASFTKIVMVADETSKYNRETAVMERRTRLYVRTHEGVEPTVGDSIMTEGAAAFLQSPADERFKLRYRVDRSTVLSPGGVAVLYELEVSI